MNTGNDGGREAIAFVCAHPDDLCGCAGLAFRLADLGKYDLHVIDFTHGKRGLGEAAYLDGSCRAQRIQEEEAACAMLGAQLHWLDEIDGDSYARPETCAKLAALLSQIRPRAAIAHWPIDCHADHSMSAAAFQRAMQLSRVFPEVYFMEQVHQSRHFHADRYVDITTTAERKYALLGLYVCQSGDQIAAERRIAEMYHGRKIGVEFAEAYADWPLTMAPGRCLLDEII